MNYLLLCVWLNFSPYKLFNRDLRSGLNQETLGAAMVMHYYLSNYGMCPTPIAVGLKNTGKSTAVTALLAALGIPQPQFFATSQLLHQVILAISRGSNQVLTTHSRGGRSMSKTTTVARSLGIITIKFDRLGKLCSNYK